MISVTLRQGTLNNSLSMVSMWTYPPTNEQGGQTRWGGGGGAERIKLWNTIKRGKNWLRLNMLKKNLQLWERNFIRSRFFNSLLKEWSGWRKNCSDEYLKGLGFDDDVIKWWTWGQSWQPRGQIVAGCHLEQKFYESRSLVSVEMPMSWLLWERSERV